MNATIGHNAPPSQFEMLQTHIEDLIALADGCLTGDPIDTEAKADAVAEIQNDIKKARSDAENARKAEKEPYLSAGRDVDAKYKPLLDRADIAAKTASAALTPFRLKQQEERDRLALEKRQEAERLAQEARDKFQASDPSDLEARLDAESALKKAKVARAIANKTDRAATGLITFWTTSVNDYGALLAHLKTSAPDDLRAMLDEYAERQKNLGVRILPGVEFTEGKRAR